MSSFVYLSKASKITNAPLVVMLHGYSSNESDLFSFASLIPSDYHVVSLQAPLSLGMGYAWFPIHFEENMERWTSPEEAQHAIDYVTSFLTYYTEKNDVDANNITLLGFSQGAMLSYSVGLAHPNVSAIAALSGYLDPRLVRFDNLNKTIYVSHGEQDVVVPYAWAAQSVALLKENGYSPTWLSYPQGHGVNQDNLNSLMQWLQEQL
ncbi:alpha/beta fold hydrolase [Flavobacteriaceae bacterium]|jgi:phospholipase/carboxylesterase|nr:alpha/beta fold hydrolase [Flavobacteriaceae bacterium]